MSDFSISPRIRFSAFEAVASCFTPSTEPGPPHDPVANIKAERALLHEVMERDPDAFSCEHDVITLLYGETGRF